MKKCKNCLEMYDIEYPTAGYRQFKIFGDHCPYCSTFNSDINRDSIIALLIAVIIFGLIYFLT
jgi:hypothetical protein